MSARRVTFVIPGNGVSGNHYKQPMASKVHGGRQYVTSKAATFKSAVYGIAFQACEEARFELPEYVRVDVSVCNMRYDRDNAVKVLYDAMQGVCYRHDSRILDGAIRIVRDRLEPRYIVTVVEIGKDALPRYRQGRLRNDPPPISHEEWVAGLT